ncbi:Polysaccharide biosynthesis protein [Rhodococcus rhodochrous]|nr:oligosaccharide flippase family protein [Rhodococcus rhodochrous]MBF4478310.1 oligosaccharide flippase family protein [Rhodococcus rhodochrous]MDO1486873.1 oligosaccharide flippase family protein [Rhodococcus rhodochrous]SNV24875.1 Polysaccharide biosynthesis protein [Rhodococcus rhodochrous]
MNGIAPASSPLSKLWRRATSEKARGVFLYGLGPALGILSGPILAHAMGAEGRGQFASIMQPITMAAAVASLGIPSAVAYFIARGRNARDCYRLGLFLGIVPTAIVIAVMVFYGRIVSENQNIPYFFLLACWSSIIVSAVVQIRRGSWQGVGQWRLLDIERGAGAVLRFLFVVVVALVGITSATYFSAAALISFVIAAAILFIPLPKDNSRSGDWSSMGKYSLLASIGTISTIASSRLDQLLMPAAASARELGYYAVAVTVAEIPLVLATLAARNSLQKSAKGASNIAIMRECLFFFAVCVLAVLAILVTAPIVTPIVFGSDFGPSVLPMQILAISSLLTWVSVVASSVLSGRGYPGIGSVISIASLGTTVVAFVVFWSAVSSMTASVIALGSSAVGAIVGVLLLAKLPRPRRTVEMQHVKEGLA